MTPIQTGAFGREKFHGEKIPTLQEAVEECISLQLTIYFDVKGHPDEVCIPETRQGVETGGVRP